MSEWVAENKKLVIAVLGVIILAAVVASGVNPLPGTTVPFVVPGPEGPRISNYGVISGVGGTLATAQSISNIGNNFSWAVNPTPSVIEVSHNNLICTFSNGGKQCPSFYSAGGLCFSSNGCATLAQYYAEDSGTLVSEVQSNPTIPNTAQPPTNAAANNAYIFYQYIKNANGTVSIIETQIVVVPVTFEVAWSIALGSGLYQFGQNPSGFAVEYQIDNTVWENAFPQFVTNLAPLQTNSSFNLVASKYRGGFPIFAWISAYSDWSMTTKDGTQTQMCYQANTGLATANNACDHVAVDPSYVGRSLDLYSSPTNGAYNYLTTQQIISNPSTFVNDFAYTPQSAGLPDPRFSQT